ncbi:MAG: hypothetical protein ACRYF3_14755 [Janthinobacterium lividum]
MRARASGAWRHAHLLLLPAGTDPHAVVELARLRDVDLARGADGAVRLPSGARLLGPVPVGPLTRRLLDLPGTPGPGRAAVVVGITADGPPSDVELLQGLARRLGGLVRRSGTRELLQPDVGTAVDLMVKTSTWVEPAQLLRALQHALPEAESARSGDLEELLDADPVAATPEPYVVSGSRDGVDLLLLVHPVDRAEDDADDTLSVDYEVRLDGPTATPDDTVRTTVAAVAAAVLATTGGVVVDDDAFAVDLADKTAERPSAGGDLTAEPRP